MHESRPVIALDFPSFEEVKAFLALFPEDETLYVKIGMVQTYHLQYNQCLQNQIQVVKFHRLTYLLNNMNHFLTYMVRSLLSFHHPRKFVVYGNNHYT